MAKVTFEFDDTEDNDDVLLVTNRHKLMRVLYEVSDLYKIIYNGKLYSDDVISVKDNKVLTQDYYDEYQKQGILPVKGTTEYIKSSYIEDKLDSILSGVRDLLDV